MLTTGNVAAQTSAQAAYTYYQPYPTYPHNRYCCCCGQLLPVKLNTYVGTPYVSTPIWANTTITPLSTATAYKSTDSGVN